MSDKLSPTQRHKCMSHIRAKDTKPEMVVRRWLWSEGWRYRLYVSGFLGKPDIVIRKIKTVIFVNGCFWHGHNVEAVGTEPGTHGVVELTDSVCCKIPHTNREFWLRKITRNRQRDYRNYAAYHQAGWRVLVVWECMLKPKCMEQTLMALSQRLNEIFLDTVRKPKIYKCPEDDSSYTMAAEPEVDDYHK
ncbi:very short patch repair endonuclease [Prevotella sp. PINT]|uniref:very short patch repair endonuclease n=1 Tax=Palleniella intestinalis TaxID=2736291 RepID=UPI0015518C4C|nr:very short patch repair endonuclease [Palleniella intestinalis]NPD81138.1 very short patch repair endonuclease [Palleniella intestinalis]